jgi:pimeloyl-ACP methyl ester carboxylesterase
VSVDEHTIELAGSPVFYRSAPAARTNADPVLYLHGVPTSSDDWLPFLAQTGGLAPDLLGFGRSGKGGHLDYSIEGHADFIEWFLREQRIERVRLVVHDWGAGGGLAFAQRAPERVSRLVIIDALPLLPGYRWHRPARLLRQPLLGELIMGSTTRGLFARLLRQGGPWSDEQVAVVWKQLDQGTQRAILRLHRSAGEQRLAQAGQHLTRLQAPALLIWGERDPWFPPSLSGQYANVLPHSTQHRVPNAGHWPWMEDPTVIDTIAAFLHS